MNRIIAGLAGIFVLVLSVGMVAAAWPMLPAMGLISLSIIISLATCAGVVGIYYLYVKTDQEKAKSEAIRLEAAKIHADNSAIFITRTQIAQLTPGPLGYGTTSHLSHYSPRIEYGQPEIAQPLIAPVALVEPPLVQPLTAVQALQLLPRNQLSWCFGLDEKNQPVTSTIAEAVHVLNVGGTGQGKTTLTANLVYQLVMGNEADLYSLLIADIKGTIARPFAPWCLKHTTNPAEYVEVMATARRIVEDRRANDDFTGRLVVVVIEEALALKRYLEKEQLTAYAQHLDVVALVGREYNVFLVACSQVDYSSKDFQNSRGQFMTRLAGAVMPTAATSMGFVNKPLINRLWQERRPGQFLLESPTGDRLIRTPVLDLRGGELTRLLPAREPAHARTAQDGFNAPRGYNSHANPENRPETVYSRQSGAFSTDQQTTEPIAIEGTYRELPATPQELTRAYQAWQGGANSVRKLAAALDIGHGTAQRLIGELKAKGYI